MKKIFQLTKTIFIIVDIFTSRTICMEPKRNIYDIILEKFERDTTSFWWSKESYYKQYSTPLLETYLFFANKKRSNEKEFEALAIRLTQYLEKRPDKTLTEHLPRQPLPSWHNIREAIYFYDNNKPYFEFTNFSHYPVKIDGERWPTTEHYYQAMKFIDKQIQGKIKNMSTAREAFSFAQKNRNLIRKDWHQVNISFMVKAVTAKFTQYQKLKKLLIDTNFRVLVEDAKEKDNFYGAGADYKGENHLGRILMHIRRNITTNQRLPYNQNTTFTLHSQELRHLLQN